MMKLKKLMTECFYTLGIACLYFLIGFVAANFYLAVRDLVKAIYHICIGG